MQHITGVGRLVSDEGGNSQTRRFDHEMVIPRARRGVGGVRDDGLGGG